MKQIPVGSVCVIVKAHNSVAELIGRECTVVEGLHETSWGYEGYSIEIQGESEGWSCPPDYIKLRKFPPHLYQWCNEMMLKTLKPVEIKDEEIVK